MRLLLLLFALPILSCQNSKTVKLATKAAKDTSVVLPTTIADSAAIEFIEYSKLKINGKLYFDCNLNDLYTVLGKPDSLVMATDICISAFNSDSVYYAYFDNTFAETYKDSASVSSVDFRSGKVRLVHPDFILDRNTTLESLRKYFPAAVKAASPVNTDIGDAIWINLQTDRQPTDFQWLLIFQKGKLARVDLNTPC